MKRELTSPGLSQGADSMISRCLRLLVCVALTLNCSGCLTFDSPITSGNIPPRLGDAPDGIVFAKAIRSADEQSREQSILRELRRGNVPDFLREMARIRYKARTRSGRLVTVTLWVMKDYLAVGSDHDFIRVPMNPVTAQRVADALGYMLPTARIVDEIYRAADKKLPPNPFKPSDAMVTVEEFVRHDRVIRQQLDNDIPDDLIAGHKKDVVLTNQLDDRPQKVAIYGWHQIGGLPIQPLSTVHGNWYADYSHGIRLISGMMLVDRQTYPVTEVLQDAELSPLISYEGPLTHVRYRTEEVPLKKNWWPKS